MGNLYNPKDDHRNARQKEMISTAAEDFNRTLTEHYPEYLNSSPNYATYYQIDTINSTQDKNLENVTNTLGPNSARRYKKIESLCLYGTNPLEIATQIEEYGLTTEITGNAILLPDTIIPTIGDRFIFDMSTDVDNLSNLSFMVSNVTVSGITTKKFYQIEFTLDRATQDELDKLVAPDKEFEMVQTNVGTSKDSILQKKDTQILANAKALLDGIIDKYEELFYDEDTDLFLLHSPYDNTDVWSPMTHKFIHDERLLQRNKDVLMKDIYCMDLTEKEFSQIYNRRAYFDSLYSQLAKGVPLKRLNPDMVNVTYHPEYSAFDTCRNLPFYVTGTKFSMLNISVTMPNAFDPLYGRYSTEPIETVSPTDWDIENNIFPLEYDTLPNGKLMYFDLGGMRKEIFRFSHNKIERLNLLSRAARKQYYIKEDGELDEEHTVENIIMQYLNDEFVLDKKTLIYINESFYNDSILEYLFLPIVMFIIKKGCEEIERPIIGERK